MNIQICESSLNFPFYLDVRIVERQTIDIGNVRNKRTSPVKSHVINVVDMVTLLLIVKSKGKALFVMVLILRVKDDYYGSGVCCCN